MRLIPMRTILASDNSELNWEWLLPLPFVHLRIQINTVFKYSFVITTLPVILTHLAYRANAKKVWYTVGTQRAYFELKYFKIVKMRDAKYSLKMAAEKMAPNIPFFKRSLFLICN